jgi:hypothetical protein
VRVDSVRSSGSDPRHKTRQRPSYWVAIFQIGISTLLFRGFSPARRKFEFDGCALIGVGEVGERAPVKINGEATTLHWRDEHTLVIGENDARHIVTTEVDGHLRCFICGDADGERYGLEQLPDDGDFIIYKDKP